MEGEYFEREEIHWKSMRVSVLSQYGKVVQKSLRIDESHVRQSLDGGDYLTLVTWIPCLSAALQTAEPKKNYDTMHML